MKHTHTPGPWQVAERLGLPVIMDGDGFHVADVIERRGVGRGFSPETTGNARLIAAAPCLLQALESLVSCIQDTRGPNAYSALESARLAIAKAGGAK